MRFTKLAVIAALLVPLGACTTLQTLSQTQVPVKVILVAGNGVDAAETTATAYVRACTPNPAPKGCDDALIRTKLVPAVTAVRVARNAAEQFVADNPDAKFGPSTLVSAVTTSVAALQQIVSAYAVTAK